MVEKVLRTGLSEEPARLPDAVRRRARPGPIQVSFGGAVVGVTRGCTLLEAARFGNVDLRSYCGGNCSCGTCRVEVVSGGQHLSRRLPMEEFVLGEDGLRRGDRLACQSQVLGDVSIRVPAWF
jgi:ferredoxin